MGLQCLALFDAGNKKICLHPDYHHPNAAKEEKEGCSHGTPCMGLSFSNCQWKSNIKNNGQPKFVFTSYIESTKRLKWELNKCSHARRQSVKEFWWHDVSGKSAFRNSFWIWIENQHTAHSTQQILKPHRTTTKTPLNMHAYDRHNESRLQQ